MNFNWIDGVIVAVSLYAVIEGWEDGLLRQITGLATFAVSLFAAVKLHRPAGQFIAEKFGVAAQWSLVLGYLVVAAFTDIVLSLVWNEILHRLPQRWRGSKVNRWLGGAFSGLKGLVFISFVLLLIMALPVRGSIKNDVSGSVFGSRLVLVAGTYGGDVKYTIDQVAAEAVRFLTIKPGSTETIPLPIGTEGCSFEVDSETEKQMIRLVNEERAKAGAGTLTADEKITAVARSHSRDMFDREYFSHYTPEGKDAGDRMENGGVDYLLAGENIAFAPDLATAHKGLMESEGHRKNILEPRFARIGIGVIDGGDCQLMFTQNFAN